MMKSALVSLVIVASVLAFCAPSEAASDSDKLCIVVDAGHGGRDTGSIGPKGLKEKDVVLDIAEGLRGLLQTRLNARVVLTRRGDYYMTLENRANMANTAKEGTPADLLISIHADACLGPAVNGFKVFYAAKRHEFDLDEIIQMEGTTVDDGGLMTNRQDLIESARWDGLYRKHSNANKLLASSVAAALEKNLSMPKLLVAPAVLRLARGLDMPAALVEIGFLSNSAGETMLSTEDFRDTCALALLEGVRTYLDERRGLSRGLGQTRQPSTTSSGASMTERTLD